MDLVLAEVFSRRSPSGKVGSAQMRHEAGVLSCNAHERYGRIVPTFSTIQITHKDGIENDILRTMSKIVDPNGLTQTQHTTHPETSHFWYLRHTT